MFLRTSVVTSCIRFRRKNLETPKTDRPLLFVLKNIRKMIKKNLLLTILSSDLIWGSHQH